MRPAVVTETIEAICDRIPPQKATALIFDLQTEFDFDMSRLRTQKPALLMRIGGFAAPRACQGDLLRSIAEAVLQLIMEFERKKSIQWIDFSEE